ncbi:tyrosine-type recombinase/integrase [Candidatus Parcubacteria bacterium]|nr:tyrosine-type recombinase/integrase [Patescibacteria group bacterium]MBU4309048.1 tyrosine-type recombinase/integrase [Patescibacteria group bacterium]MBU4431928.1 tyrosine-type recombinase/integrase [Patescibacteria group bacterium]MBU4577409.1 tyrosine-type recombinase/integrase [Patescibacteria group bacterium]MCG2697097.1 tyrosine-type recombinase/integrase [Candidatus Parcubacteria bacterium]
MTDKPITKYLTDYLDYIEIEKGLSSKTQENYSRFLTKFFKWLAEVDLDTIEPGQLTTDHVYKYRVYLSRFVDPRTKKSLKKTTQNYYLIALRSLLDFFVEKKIATLSPSSIKLAKDKSDKEIKFLKLDQLERLLLTPDVTTIIGLRDRAILETLFSTGLRVAELASLNLEQLRINDATEELEVAVVGKGSKVRTVYFSERTINWLRKYLNKRNDFDDALFINYKPGIDKTNNPRRLTTRSVEDIVKKYVKISGLPIMATPHTLRHSFATDLLSQGADLRIVQEFLGHRNIATTQIYTHVTNKQLRDIHKKLHSGKDLKK